MAYFETPEEFCYGLVFDGNSIKEIAVGIEQDKQIFVPSRRFDWVTAWEVSGNHVLEFLVGRGVDNVNNDMLSAAVGGSGCGWIWFIGVRFSVFGW